MSLFGKKPAVTRSSKWPALEKAHLRDFPTCAACGTKKKVTVHHKQPVHLFPDLELEPSNLITLCESPVHNCHFLFGHALCWRSYVASVVEDAAGCLKRLFSRPIVKYKP